MCMELSRFDETPLRVRQQHQLETILSQHRTGPSRPDPRRELSLASSARTTQKNLGCLFSNQAPRSREPVSHACQRASPRAGEGRGEALSLPPRVFVDIAAPLGESIWLMSAAVFAKEQCSIYLESPLPPQIQGHYDGPSWSELLGRKASAGRQE